MQALERMLAAGQCPATGDSGTGGAGTPTPSPGTCTAVPKRPRRAGAALTLVSGAGHDALALADLTKVLGDTHTVPHDGDAGHAINSNDILLPALESLTSPSCARSSVFAYEHTAL